MRRLPFCMLGLFTAAGLTGWGGTSHACCNVLPVVSRDYQSTLGSVRERIAAPGNTVTITRKPCDTASGVMPPFFDPVPSNNAVSIAFHPPAGGGTTVNTIGYSVEQCDRSGSCVTCLSTSPFPCNTLRFTMPDTDAAFPPSGDGDGLTGPATVTVTRGGTTVAEIGPLHQPSDQCDCGGGSPSAQCDQQRDGVFKHFTVLPTPNDFQPLAGGGGPLRMTVDGGGNLLVPLHHPPSAYASNQPGIADWERGEGTFDAFPRSWWDPIGVFVEKIAEQLGGAPQDVLQVFTISGQRVAPLFEHDDHGGLFGLADVEYSVLRFAREGTAGGPLYDVAHRMTSGNGLVKIDRSGGIFSGSQFKLANCGPTKVASVRLATGAVARADDTSTVRIHERAKAGQDCGTDTAMTAAGDPSGGAVDVALAAQDSLVAFLTQGGPMVEAFSAQGQHLTPAQSQAAATTWSVNNRFVAVGDSLAYFYFWDPKDPRYAKPMLRTFNRTAKTFEDVAPADAAVVAGRRAVTREPETGMAYAHRYPWGPSGNHTPLNVTAAHLAIAPDLIAVADAPTGQLSVWPWPATSPAPTTPPQTPAVKTNQPLGITSACAGAACTRRVVVNSQAAAGGNHVLQLYDPATLSVDNPVTPGMPNTTATAVDFVAGERLVAFRTSEAAQGGVDLNNDGDTGDVVMRVVAFDGLPPLSPRVIETGWPAAGWADVPMDVLGWRTPYKVAGDDIFFVTRECDQRGTNHTGCSSGGTDLDGDGDAGDLVLQIFHYGSNTVQSLVAVGTAPVQIPLSGGVSVQVASVEPSGGLAVAERALEGVLDASDTCQAASDPRQFDDTADRACGASASCPSAKMSGGIAVGDGDDDGVLDQFDNCETISNPRQFDDDRDRLGDRICDPTYCTTFTPPALTAPSLAPRRRLMTKLIPSIISYLTVRSGRSLGCLDRIATGDLVGDPETLCRGSFVAEVENPPIAVGNQANAHGARAASAFRGLLDTRASHRTPSVALLHAERQLIRSLGEGINAATRITYGEVTKLDAEARAFQSEIGKASALHLQTLVVAMSECIGRGTDGERDAVALCLGRIEAGQLVLPTDSKTAERVREANEKLRVATDDRCDGCLLAKLNTCASDARRERGCFVCTNWRNAVEVVARLSEFLPAAQRLRVAHAARK